MKIFDPNDYPIEKGVMYTVTFGPRDLTLLDKAGIISIDIRNVPGFGVLSELLDWFEEFSGTNISTNYNGVIAASAWDVQEEQSFYHFRQAFKGTVDDTKQEHPSNGAVQRDASQIQTLAKAADVLIETMGIDYLFKNSTMTQADVDAVRNASRLVADKVTLHATGNQDEWYSDHDKITLKINPAAFAFAIAQGLDIRVETD